MSTIPWEVQLIQRYVGPVSCAMCREMAFIF